MTFLNILSPIRKNKIKLLGEISINICLVLSNYHYIQFELSKAFDAETNYHFVDLPNKFFHFLNTFQWSKLELELKYFIMDG